LDSDGRRRTAISLRGRDTDEEFQVSTAKVSTAKAVLRRTAANGTLASRPRHRRRISGLDREVLDG
jgi:hypothetical protein